MPKKKIRRPVPKQFRDGKPDHSYINRRRRVLREVQGEYPDRPLGWRDGFLHFLDTNKLVPGIDPIYKSDEKGGN